MKYNLLEEIGEKFVIMKSRKTIEDYIKEHSGKEKSNDHTYMYIISIYIIIYLCIKIKGVCEERVGNHLDYLYMMKVS